jgi:hypothetical protein
MRPLHRLFAAFATGMLLYSGAVLALAPATVEQVQAPAWLERDGRSQPLAPGMELRNGDLVRTGPGARAYLMLAEGSRVKLGESARFNLHNRNLHPEKSFSGALDILAGRSASPPANSRRPCRENWRYGLVPPPSAFGAPTSGARPTRTAIW